MTKAEREYRECFCCEDYKDNKEAWCFGCKTELIWKWVASKAIKYAKKRGYVKKGGKK